MKLYRGLLRALVSFQAVAAALVLLAISGVCLLVTAQPAAAVPSFARQTGQPCASCHTAFPELTPFGRRFKLNGYTLEGGDSKIPLPIAAMIQSSLTEYVRKLDAPAGTYAPPSPNGGFKTNDNIDPMQMASLFYAGKVYGNLGAFVQATFVNAYARNFALDLTDIRYADTAKIGSLDFTWGLTANNAPSVQDVWNTTPQWSFPYIKSVFSLNPAASTMIEGFGSSQTAGGGAYIFAHDLVYAEVSAYDSLTPRAQTTLGVSPPAIANFITGAAPYWRFAVEPNWGEHSLMLGTFGMHANILPNHTFGFGTDKITDIGVDSQYQWIGDVHAITARASYIYEHQQLDASSLLGNSANLKNHLRSFKVSASYIYDHTISITGGYFLLTGSPDALVFANNTNFSPNTQGWIADIAYMPFSKGAPGPWPWANTRIGVSYTWYTKFDGGKADIDPVQCPLCRKSRDNNTLLLYAFTAF
jgi:hypothetical protein